MAVTILGGATGSLGIKIASVGIGFVVQLVLTHMLGADGYGDYAYALAWQNVLLLAGTLGFDTAAMRFVSVYRAESRWDLLRGFLLRSRRIVLVASMSASFIALALVVAFRDNVRPGLQATMVVAFLLVPFTALTELGSRSLLGLRQIMLAQAPRDILRPVLLGLGVWMLAIVAPRYATATGAMGVNVITVAAALGVTAWGTRRFLRPLLRAVEPVYRVREWTNVAMPLLIIGALQLLLERSDVLLLGAMRSTTEAGVYVIAQRIAALMLLGLSAVNAIAAPMIASLHAAGRRDDLQESVTVALRGVLAFALPTAVVLIVFGEYILGMFGPQFKAAYFVLVVLTLSAVLNITAGLAGHFMTMTGHQREAAWMIGGSVVVSIGLNLALIPRWGMTGAAFATAVAVLGRNIALTTYIRRKIGIRISPFARKAHPAS